MKSGWWSRYGEHVRLIAGGVGVLIMILVLTLVFVGYDTKWLDTLQSKEDSRVVVNRFTRFVGALHSETSLRAVVAPNAAAITTAHTVTNAQYGSLRAAIVTSGVTGRLDSLDLLYVDYETASNAIPAAVMLSHLALVKASVDLVYLVTRSKLTSRTTALVDHAAIQQAKWRLTSLTSQLGLMHRSKFIGNSASATELSELARAYVAAKDATQLLGDIEPLQFPQNILGTAASTISQAFTPTTPAVNTSIKTATVNAAYGSLLSQYYYLKEESSTLIEAGSSTVRTRIIVFAVGAGIAFVAMVACVIIVARHIVLTRRARQLMIAFRNPEQAKALMETYYPILHDMRIQTSRLPGPPTNDVEREYSVAAKLSMQLRPLLPQALFGDLNTHHKRQPNGSWDIGAQSIRLEMGMAFSTCTVLTIAINSNTLNHGTKEMVGGVLSEASMALNAIVEEVNNSGGIVIGCGAGGRISCVWNATHIIDDAAFVAVKTARIIDKRLEQLNIGRDLNIASGSVVVANSKIGNRKHVTFIGGAFDVAEKLLLLNEGHVARLITDYETFKELPREQQRTCKPIAVISDKDDGPPIVVMSADEDAALKGEQWKQYNTAFTLYQNNMLSESLTEFRKYLQVHPNDHCATWLIENVLEPRIGRRKSVAALKSN